MLWGIIVIIAVVLDQVSKYIIDKNVEYQSMIPVIDKFFYITYSRNTGAAWGMFKNGRYYFIALTFVISIALVYMIIKSDNKFLKLSLSMILGGALGNFIDRVRVGSVTDFLDFWFGSYNFPTFNVADSFVVVGTILLAIYMLFIYKEPEKTSVE
ncbi:MAG: signal peptidase II [Clostridia bacterium]|nr:signal peptidase II [Clostridia bacterium]